MKFYRAPRTEDIQNFVSVIYTHAIVEAVYALRHLTPDAGVWRSLQENNEEVKVNKIVGSEHTRTNEH